MGYHQLYNPGPHRGAEKSERALHRTEELKLSFGTQVDLKNRACEARSERTS